MTLNDFVLVAPVGGGGNITTPGFQWANGGWTVDIGEMPLYATIPEDKGYEFSVLSNATAPYDLDFANESRVSYPMGELPSVFGITGGLQLDDYIKNATTNHNSVRFTDYTYNDIEMHLGITPNEDVLYRVKGSVTIGGEVPTDTNSVSVFLTGRNNDDNSTRRLPIQPNGDFITNLQGIQPTQKYSLYTLWGDVDDINAQEGLIVDKLSPSAYLNGFANKLDAAPDLPMYKSVLTTDDVTIDFNNEPTIKTMNILDSTNVIDLGIPWLLAEASTNYTATNKIKNSPDHTHCVAYSLNATDADFTVSLAGGNSVSRATPAGLPFRHVTEINNTTKPEDNTFVDITGCKEGRFVLGEYGSYNISDPALSFDNIDSWESDLDTSVYFIENYPNFNSKYIEPDIRDYSRAIMFESTVVDNKIQRTIDWPYDYTPGTEVVYNANLLSTSMTSYAPYIKLKLLDADGETLDEVGMHYYSTEGLYSIEICTYYGKSVTDDISASGKLPMHKNTRYIQLEMYTTDNDPDIAYRNINIAVINALPKQDVNTVLEIGDL